MKLIARYISILLLTALACAQINSTMKGAARAKGNAIVGSDGTSEPILISVLVSPSSATLVVAGACPGTGCQQFTARANYSDGSSIDVTQACGAGWVSSDPTKATVSNGGLATAVAAGSTNVTCTYQNVQSNAAAVTVVSAPQFHITTTTLPPGTQGTAYASGTIHSLNGAAPCAWTITSGSLPPGLSLTASSNPCDPTAITGTPTTPGTYSFNVHGVDNLGNPADQPYTVAISPSGVCTDGPPYYLCTQQSNLATLGSPTAAVGILDPAAAYVYHQADPVNTNRYDTTLNQSGKNCYGELTDENTFGTNFLDGLTYTGGSGTQQASVNGDFLMIVSQGHSWIFKVDFSSLCPQVVYPPPGQPATNHAKAKALFSSVQNLKIYQQNGTALETTIIQNGSPDPTVLSAPTTIFDYSWCPHTPGVGAKQTGQSGFDIGGADEYILRGIAWQAYGESGAQGTAHNMYIFKQATHQCATLQLDYTTDNINYFAAGYDWCDPDANGHGSDHANCQGATPAFTQAQCANYTPTGKNSGFHAGGLEPMGIIPNGGYQCPPPAQPPATQFYWFYGSGAHVATSLLLTSNGLYTGHDKSGELGITVSNNPRVNYSLYSPYPTSTPVWGPFPGAGEFHPSWVNGTQDDVWDAMYTTSIADQVGHNGVLGTNLTNPFMNEFIGIDNLHAGATSARMGHNFTTGDRSSSPDQNPGSNFTCMYGQHFMTQDAKCIIFSSPMLGNLGLIPAGKPNAGHQVCRVYAICAK